jgi:hypothetical protein
MHRTSLVWSVYSSASHDTSSNALLLSRSNMCCSIIVSVPKPKIIHCTNVVQNYSTLPAIKIYTDYLTEIALEVFKAKLQMYLNIAIHITK